MGLEVKCTLCGKDRGCIPGHIDGVTHVMCRSCAQSYGALVDKHVEEQDTIADIRTALGTAFEIGEDEE